MCAYLIPVSSICISESLNVVEDKPGKRNDHQHDEGDGHKHHRRPADILLEVTSPDGNNHGYCHIVLQERSQLAAFRLWDHDGDYLPSPCRHTGRRLLVQLLIFLLISLLPLIVDGLDVLIASGTANIKQVSSGLQSKSLDQTDLCPGLTLIRGQG